MDKTDNLKMFKKFLYGMVHYLWGLPGQIKSEWVITNFVPELTGYKMMGF